MMVKILESINLSTDKEASKPPKKNIKMYRLLPTPKPQSDQSSGMDGRYNCRLSDSPVFLLPHFPHPLILYQHFFTFSD